MTNPPLCRVCGQPSGRHARARILNRYDIEYQRCGICGFIQTEQPYWLNEAYSDAIAVSDTGLLRRNMVAAAVTGSVIRAYFDRESAFVDYGGGYGVLTRMMRDAGLNFFRHDPICANIFARGFDAAPGRTYELVTAYEVFEHLVEPREDLARMLAFSDNILFTTWLVPEPAPAPSDWWYYGLNTGQHVALYTRNSLRVLAQQHGLNYFTDGRQWHLFTRKRISPLWFKLITRYRIARWRHCETSGPGLMLADHEKAKTENSSTISSP